MERIMDVDDFLKACFPRPFTMGQGAVEYAKMTIGRNASIVEVLFAAELGLEMNRMSRTSLEIMLERLKQQTELQREYSPKLPGVRFP